MTELVEDKGLRETAAKYALRRYALKYKANKAQNKITISEPLFTTNHVFDKENEGMLASYLKIASKLHRTISNHVS